MTYYQDHHTTLYNKDCRAMAELPDESVQCVVTSPPYWGLRKYAGLGDEQFGLEPTPEMYVEHTIEILREVRRVLRKDGVVFWNIGDSYASGKGTCHNPGGGSNSLEGHANLKDQGAYPLNRGNKSTLEASNLKPKDLCLIPFRVAIAAQEDGWWVRSVIIWSKLNPMPESVTDRPTESHEYILLLTKSAKYYWDADAVREKGPQLGHYRKDGRAGHPDSKTKLTDEELVNPGFREKFDNPLGRNIRSVWEFPTQPYPEAHFAVFPEKLPEICIKAASKPQDIVLDPFAGAGTTLWVAKKLNRQAIGYELSEEYCKLIIERCRQQVML